jgi:hypothetical protein
MNPLSLTLHISYVLMRRISSILGLRSVVLGLVVLTASATAALAQKPEEYDVKAAFLLNFARFAEWPAEAFVDAAAPLVIGVVGEDPFGPVLDASVAGKRVHGRRIQVRRLADGPGGFPGYHLLFFGKMASRQSRRDLLAKASELHILTVGEADDFCKDGGVINLVLRRSRVRFQIDPGAAERAGLRLSVRLLRLAELVDSRRSERKTAR